jgi:protein-S-isoprenylcysteine O-methyltransferase Ste14
MTAYRLWATVFKLRAILLLPLLVIVCLCTRWECEDDWVVWPLGLLIYALGVALRVWSQIHLKYRLRSEHLLATGGPYAYVRNPVYLANIAIFVGITVLCELIWMIPLVLAWTIMVYSLAVRFEETRLRKRYGSAYEDYCRRVPRWSPHHSASRSLARHQTLTLVRAAAVEWHTPLLLVLPLAKELIAR